MQEAGAGSGHPAVSVDIPTVDRVDLLDRCLTGLTADQGAGFEVIVVHDGHPGVTGLLDAWQGRLPLRPLRIAARGAVPKRNAGWRAARAPVVAFTDDDCQPAPGWLGAALAALGPGVDLVQGRVLPHPEDAANTGLFARTITVDGPDIGYSNSNLVYRRPAIEAAGGYDEAFWGAGEDADLAWRVIENGGGVVYAAEALVWHAVRPATFGQHLASLPRWGNLPLVLRRHPEVRAHLRKRVFWKASHTTAVPAAAGLAAAAFDRRALVLTLPHLARRIGERGLVDGVQLAAADVAEVVVVVAGSLRYRSLLL
jgi:glycosyltransferase involved in cell wall biosynthesis